MEISAIRLKTFYVSLWKYNTIAIRDIFIYFTRIILLVTGDFRLAARDENNIGRLEVYLNNTWGSICTYGINITDMDTHALCDQLGLR